MGACTLIIFTPEGTRKASQRKPGGGNKQSGGLFVAVGKYPNIKHHTRLRITRNIL